MRRFKVNGVINNKERKNGQAAGVKEKFISDRENHILMKDASLNAPLTSDTVEEWQNFLIDSKQESPEDAFIKNDEKLEKSGLLKP